MKNKQQTNVPALRFPNFKDEWKTLPFSSLYDFYPTNSLSRNDLEEGNDGTANIHYGDIHTRLPNRLNTDEEHLPRVKDIKINVAARQRPLAVRDLVFADASEDTADIGKMVEIVAIGRRKVVAGLHTIHASPKPDTKTAIGFCSELFMSTKIRRAVIRESQGAKVLGISAKKLGAIDMQFPSLEEQEKISTLFGATQDKIDQLHNEKLLLEAYKKTWLHKLCSQEVRFKNSKNEDYPMWDEKYLSEISNIYDGTHQTPNYMPEGVPFYSVEHLTANNFESTKFISEEVFAKECKRVKINKGDILLTRIGDIGTVRLIDWDVRASFYVSLALVKCNPGVHSAYISQYFQSVEFQKELWHRTIHVAFPRKINLGEIGNCQVKLPHFEEQEKIARFLSAIDTKLALASEELAHARTFKKGLLQKMFV